MKERHQSSPKMLKKYNWKLCSLKARLELNCELVLKHTADIDFYQFFTLKIIWGSV
jgi:hypothetical protein